jgi:hypothetical protein
MWEFLERVVSHWERFWEVVLPFWGRVLAFWDRVLPFWGKGHPILVYTVPELFVAAALIVVASVLYVVTVGYCFPTLRENTVPYFFGLVFSLTAGTWSSMRCVVIACPGCVRRKNVRSTLTTTPSKGDASPIISIRCLFRPAQRYPIVLSVLTTAPH